VVTGGSSGIGLASAGLLLDHGASVVAPGTIDTPLTAQEDAGNGSSYVTGAEILVDGGLAQT
jgi:NAD(P)-dependent dehydrogenase (short-subunit alcohol dehydrogenase family)